MSVHIATAGISNASARLPVVAETRSSLELCTRHELNADNATNSILHTVGATLGAMTL
jgi:hypothetical protein